MRAYWYMNADKFYPALLRQQSHDRIDGLVHLDLDPGGRFESFHPFKK